MSTDKSKTPLILMVDDDTTLLRSLARGIQRILSADCELRTAHDSKEVLAKADELLVYDRVMLITDGNMPQVQGPELIRGLQAVLGHRLRSRVLMSGRLQEHLKAVEGLDVVLLNKPMELIELRNLVSQFLAGT